GCAWVGGPRGPAACARQADATSAPSDATGAIALTATVKDRFGNLAAGVPVAFAASGTGNAFDPPGGVTDSSGKLTARFTSTRAEGKRATATIAAAFDLTLEGLTFVPGDPDADQSALQASAPSLTVDESASIALTAVLRDANGNAIPGLAGVTVLSSGTGDTFTPSATGTTDADGKLTLALSSTVAQA